MVAGLLRAFPDYHETIDDMVAEGDKVVARVRWTGTHQGKFQGIAPTGKQVTYTAITIYRITGGKIAEVWEEGDTLGLMQQLGVIPTPGQGTPSTPILHRPISTGKEKQGGETLQF